LFTFVVHISQEISFIHHPELSISSRQHPPFMVRCLNILIFPAATFLFLTGNSADRPMKLKSIFATLCLLVLAITAFCVIGYYDAAREAALQENHQLSLDSIADATERTEVFLQDRRQTLARLASMDLVLSSLSAQSSRPDIGVNQLLAELQSDFPGSVFSLFDHQGNIVASSDLSGTGSLAGLDHAISPYLQETLPGKDIALSVVNMNSGRKGLFMGYPIREPSGGGIIGVAAAELPFDGIGQVIGTDRPSGIIALTGPDDLVVISNRQELEKQYLWQGTTPEKLAAPDRDRQVNSAPRTWAGFKKIDLRQALGPDGKNYTIHHHRINSLPGWNLLYLHDSKEFANQLSARLSREIGLFLTAVLLLVGLFVFLLYRLAEREIREKKGLEEQLRANQHLLENKVIQRTKALWTTNEELLLEMDRHQEATEKLAKSYMTKELLNQILGLALKGSSLQDFLNDFMKHAAAFAELGLLSKGALFLVDEENPGFLRLKAHYGLDQSLLVSCNRVKFGHCLCGQAASDGKVLFAGRVDERHENTYDGIEPHGHYCVPILSPDLKLIGLYNVYTKPDVQRDPHVEDFLVTVATALSGIIRLKQASHQVTESEEKHRAITNTAHEAIITIDHLGKTTFWNPAATRIFGYSVEEALGSDLHQLITPERFLSEANHGLENFVKTGRGALINRTVEITGRRKDGREIDVELSLSALHQQKHWTALGILRDISSRKKNENEKTQLQSQLRQAQKMEAIGTLAGGIAHDFNNILSSILGYAEMVREELPPSNTEVIDDIDQVIKAGNRAKELVRQILTFSRQSPEELVPVQISLIIKEAIKLLRSSLPSSIEIRQFISDSALTVFADPSQIHQVLMNLCTNSFRAMREKGGILEVRLESFTPGITFSETYPDLRASRYMILVVRDTGIGMDSSILPRIFEPYFSTNKKEDGTGLGLAVVHGIVTRLGGTIEVDSTVGAGSTFRVYLPVAEKHELPAELPVSGFPPQGTERILLVDDELPILELGSRMLSGLGYRVTCRTSSIEALELFRNQPDKFDLVITDQNMPNMTGTKMADEIIGVSPRIPIILCTGYTDLNLGRHSLGGSIQEIIMKPVAKSQLAEAVRRVLDRFAKSACQ
jgi:PAS domain S-box-containing protein